MTINEMMNLYKAMAGTHLYMLGFTFKNVVYMARVTTDIAVYAKADRASKKNGGGLSARFAPTVAMKKALMATGAVAICSAEEFIAARETVKGKNKGDTFEMLVAHMNGLDWQSSGNKKFTEGGDLHIDGAEWQLKFEGATFTNETTLRNLMAA